MLASDGRLRVVWRAIARDDSNYLREEIELDAPQEDIGVREIVWLDDNLPGARQSGSVDGSPIVKDNLFLGSEDPMATNKVAASGEA